MKNYSRAAAGKGKTAFRTGDKWRARKNISIRNIKSSKKIPTLRAGLYVQLSKKVY